MTDKKRAKRRLSNMRFDYEGAHMALVSVDQNGGANGVNTLVMKAAEDTSQMNEQQIKSLKEILMSVEGISDEEAGQMIGNVTDVDTSGGNPVSEVEKASDEATTPEEDNNMSDVDVQAEVQKALAAKEQEMAEIQKGLTEQLELYKAKVAEQEAKEAEVKKAQFVEIAKGYSALGVGEEQVEATAVALMKAQGDEQLKPLLDMIEKGQKLAENIEKGVFQEQGHNVDDEAEKVSGVMKALQAQKANESK